MDKLQGLQELVRGNKMKELNIKKPLRVSVTISGDLYSRLVIKSFMEGRSVSNLCAYLIERGMINEKDPD